MHRRSAIQAFLLLLMPFTSSMAQVGEFCVEAPLPTVPSGPRSAQTWSRTGQQFVAILWRVACDSDDANVLIRIVPDRDNSPEICSDLFLAHQGDDDFDAVKIVLDPDEPKFCDMVSTPTTFVINQKDDEQQFNDDLAFSLEYRGEDDRLVLDDYDPDVYNAAGNQIAPGHSGSWYDPQRDGEGFELEVVKIGDVSNLVVYWYTFDDQGNQMYVTGTEPFEEGATSVTVPLLVTGGAVFGPGFDPGDVERNNWGTIRFAFDSCNSATATYSSIDFGAETIDLARLTSIIDLPCP